MIKKALSIITVLALLVFTFASCNVETVKEHDAKTSSSEIGSEMSSSAEESTTVNSKSENTTGTDNSIKNTPKESNNQTGNVETNSETGGQGTTQSKVEQTAGKDDNRTTENKKTHERAPEKPVAQPQSIKVTVSVTCQNAVGNESLKSGIDLPKDGFIINTLSIDVKKGESVFDATKKACEKSGTTFLFNGSVFGQYVSKIGPIAEKECGDGSGWTYTVNGKYPNVTCNSVILKNGDSVEWIYKLV